MIECPECGTNFRGTKCSCGYSAATNSRPKQIIPCAYENCRGEAMSNEFGANLCRAHWHDHHLMEVRRTLDAWGLKTKEEKREYRNRILKAGIFKTSPQKVAA